VQTFEAPYNKSLDASGGSASRNLLGTAKGASIRAAASTQPFGFFSHMAQLSNEAWLDITSSCRE
jgi:hypothetical protein